VFSQADDGLKIYSFSIENFAAYCACANTSDTKRPLQTLITSTVLQRFGPSRAQNESAIDVV